MIVSLRETLDSGIDSMRAQARTDGVAEPIFLRDLVAPRPTPDLTSGLVSVTEDWSTVGLSGVPSTDRVVIASIDTFAGSDPVGVRMRNVDADEMELFLEEETSGEDETGHVSEHVGLLATTSGPIYDGSGSHIGEAGRVSVGQPDAGHWHTVELNGTYANPVVLMQVMSYNGGHPCHIRLQNVDSNAFQYRIEEWAYLDGAHTEERLGYVVIETGVHDIDGEVTVEAGTTQTTHEFSEVQFRGEFGCHLVFITRCQTYNGGHEVVTRNRALQPHSADVRLQEEEGRDGQHTDETIGYLGVPHLSLDNRRPVDEFHASCHGFAFGNSFTDLPDLPDLPGNVGDRIDHISPRYGLCGGMSLAARDFFLHDRSIPDADETPQSGPLFDYLWQRQIDSFDPANGYLYLAKFLKFYSNTTFTRAKSSAQLRSVTQALDHGKYPILGLVYVRSGDGNIWDNHQVLALDYTDSGDTTRISVYDPNVPSDQPLTNDVEIRVELEDAGFFAPEPKKIDATQYRGGEEMVDDDVGTLDVIGLIHMDVPSQEPPHHL